MPDASHQNHVELLNSKHSTREENLLFSFFGTVEVRGILVKVKPDRTLDCTGLYCPEPVFKTRLEMDELKVGETLEVLADDPAAEPDIRSLVKNLEQELVSVSREGNTVRILIRRIK
jgi:tRNA 2-thiouridine synthesizing protein A